MYLLKLDSPYPERDIFFKVLNNSSRIGREVLASLLLTEGVPRAFAKCPSVYEFIRRWLSAQMGIHVKQITLLGSARMGYSLSPYKFGKKFSSNSDLDLSIISECIFNILQKEADRFIHDYKNMNIIPNTDRKRLFWEENVKFLERNLPYGFIDVNKVPYIKERYPYCQYLGNLMWRLKEKINVTPNAPNIKKVSLRIYNKWSSLIDRVSFNLKCLRNKIKKP